MWRYSRWLRWSRWTAAVGAVASVVAVDGRRGRGGYGGGRGGANFGGSYTEASAIGAVDFRADSEEDSAAAQQTTTVGRAGTENVPSSNFVCSSPSIAAADGYAHIEQQPTSSSSLVSNRRVNQRWFVSSARMSYRTRDWALNRYEPRLARRAQQWVQVNNGRNHRPSSSVRQHHTSADLQQAASTASTGAIGAQRVQTQQRFPQSVPVAHGHIQAGSFGFEWDSPPHPSNRCRPLLRVPDSKAVGSSRQDQETATVQAQAHAQAQAQQKSARQQHQHAVATAAAARKQAALEQQQRKQQQRAQQDTAIAAAQAPTCVFSARDRCTRCNHANMISASSHTVASTLSATFTTKDR